MCEIKQEKNFNCGLNIQIKVTQALNSPHLNCLHLRESILVEVSHPKSPEILKLRPQTFDSWEQFLAFQDG